MIARKTRKSSKVSEFCDESKAAVAHFQHIRFQHLRVQSDVPSRMAQRPATAFAREIGLGESQNRHFMSFSGALAAISFALDLPPALNKHP